MTFFLLWDREENYLNIYFLAFLPFIMIWQEVKWKRERGMGSGKGRVPGLELWTQYVSALPKVLLALENI